MTDYAARCIRRNFSLGLGCCVGYLITSFVLQVCGIVWLMHVMAILMLLFCAFSILFGVIVILQFLFTCISIATGFGWRTKRLSERQFKNSILADGVLQEYTFGAEVRYWRAPFTKRYVEDVKL